MQRNSCIKTVVCFFVLCGSIFDLNFLLIYAIMTIETVKDCPLYYRFTAPLTTYLTIDSSGAHGNNGYKTAQEYFSWSENGYKKPLIAERT